MSEDAIRLLISDGYDKRTRAFKLTAEERKAFAYHQDKTLRLAQNKLDPVQEIIRDFDLTRQRPVKAFSTGMFLSPALAFMYLGDRTERLLAKFSRSINAILNSEALTSAFQKKGLHEKFKHDQAQEKIERQQQNLAHQRAVEAVRAERKAQTRLLLQPRSQTESSLGNPIK